MKLPGKWDSSPYLAVNALKQALSFPREGYEGCATWEPCELSGARTAKLDTASNSFTNSTHTLLGAAQKFYQSKISRHLSCSSYIWEQFGPQSGSCVLLNSFRAYVWFFFSGAYFVIMESQNGPSDPEEVGEGLEVTTDKLCHRATAGEEQDILCKLRCILYYDGVLQCQYK